MVESQRLKELREVIDAMLDNSIKEGGETKRDPKIENLISVYRDILVIDEAVKKSDREKIQETIHYAYVVNGGADISQTGPDAYQIIFVGKANSEDGKRDILRIGLEVRNKSIRFTGYELF